MNIEESTLSVLRRMTWLEALNRSTIGKLPPDLDRKLYLAADAVLREVGGKWNRGQKGHVFATDPREKLGLVIAEEKIVTAKEEGFFPTPDDVADIVVDCMMRTRAPNPAAMLRVLEPSAGDGALVRALRRKCDYLDIVAVEKNEERAAGLIASFPDVKVICGDFATMGLSLFDVVVMNPPFDKKGTHLRHLIRAFERLAVGGSLVAILPESAMGVIRQPRTALHKRLRVVFGENDIWIVRKLPRGTFEGTDVATVIVMATKPYLTPASPP